MIFVGPRYWEINIGKWFSVSWWYEGYPHSSKPYRLWFYVRFFPSFGSCSV